jgi:hypothetical protein
VVTTATTTQEALDCMHQQAPFHLVVAALGVDEATMIFDVAGDRSRLISAANACLDPPCSMVVFSHTACKNPDHGLACDDAGADAVICSEKELEALVRDEMAVLRGMAEVVAADAADAAEGKEGNKGSEGGAEGSAAAPATGMEIAAGVNPLDAEMDHAIFSLFAAATPGGLDAAVAVSLLNSILHRGGDVNFQRVQSDGTSALMAASRLGGAELVRHLLALGARGDGSVRDKFGLSTADHARAAGHAAIVALLEGRTEGRAEGVGGTGGMGSVGDPTGGMGVVGVTGGAGSTAMEVKRGVGGEMGGGEEDTYGPVVWRAERTSRLAAALGADSQQVKLCGRVGKMLEQQVGALSAPLCVRGAARPSGTVRVVHCSDTHNMHGLVYMPDGDILVHTGDAVGNYGDRVRWGTTESPNVMEFETDESTVCVVLQEVSAGNECGDTHNLYLILTLSTLAQDINEHFRSFCDWLRAQATRYMHVIFIAGNHDTLLDGAEYDDTRAKQMVAELPENVVYLENSGVELMGVRFWGSPVTPSRLELMGKR